VRSGQRASAIECGVNLLPRVWISTASLRRSSRQLLLICRSYNTGPGARAPSGGPRSGAAARTSNFANPSGHNRGATQNHVWMRRLPLASSCRPLATGSARCRDHPGRHFLRTRCSSSAWEANLCLTSSSSVSQASAGRGAGRQGRHVNKAATGDRSTSCRVHTRARRSGRTRSRQRPAVGQPQGSAAAQPTRGAAGAAGALARQLAHV
jgi:hypothetical protein